MAATLSRQLVKGQKVRGQSAILTVRYNWNIARLLSSAPSLSWADCGSIQRFQWSMEDRDPVVAVQACIAALRRGGVGEGGPPSAAELERCLRRVGEALSEKEREIEWLREALEQSRETYEERSRALGQLVGVAEQEGGVVNETSVSDTCGLESGPGNVVTTESAYEIAVSEGRERESTTDGS